MRAGIGAITVLMTLWALSSPVVAMHEVDHRFTVEGFVCGPGGEAVTGQKVIVKDTRVSVVETAYTDSYGYYKAVLHLHDDNLGDPILVIAGDREQKTKATFDLEDRQAERVTRVDFGTGCESERGVPAGVLYGLAGLVLVVVGYVGARMIRKRRRSGRKGKKARKASET